MVQINAGRMRLSWPQNRLGWQRQIQTNNSTTGFSTNRVNVPNATATCQVFLPIDPNNGSVFLRIVCP